MDESLILQQGNIKRCHLDRVRIQRKHPGPICTVQTSSGSVKAQEVYINGPSKLVYNPEKPLSCGAKAWIETKAEVVLFGVEESETFKNKKRV